MTAYTMVTTQIKELAAAREKLAQPERTIATELPKNFPGFPNNTDSPT